MMKRPVTPCLTLLLLLSCNISFGQVKAVLVKLNSQKNRIAYFEEKGNVTMANDLRKDADAAKKATILDFTDHFDLCPVYYFIDTNQNNILSSNFTGVLLDETLKPVSKPVLQNGDTDLVIVYFGIPDDVIEDKEQVAAYKSGWYPGDGLVVLGHNMKRSKRLDHYIYETPVPGWRIDKQYRFTSKTTSISYQPWADILQKRLETYNNYLQRKSSR